MGDFTKLLIATSSFPPQVGGTATYSFEVCRGLLRQNFPISLWTKAEVLRNGSIPPGFNVVTLKDTLFTPKWLLKYRTELAGQEVLNNEKPDFILVPRLDLFTTETLRWAAQNGIPFGIIVHGNEIIEKDSPVLDSKIVFCVSKAVANSLPSELQSKSIIVPNGVDTIRFSSGQVDADVLKKYNLDGSSKGVLNVGKWLPEKGQALLLDAISKLPPPPQGPELWLVGSGPEERKLRQAALRYNVYDRVKWLGQVNDDDLVTIYRSSKFVVLTSMGETLGVLEGFGLPVLEAASCGIPAVVTDSGGLPEAVVDSETGIIVSRHKIEDLSKAIDLLWNNEELRKKMGLTAQKRVYDYYTWEVVLQKLGREIRKLISKPQEIEKSKENEA